MISQLRHRLIQIVEFLLWLGAAVGLGAVLRDALSQREAGWRAVLDIAAPGLLAVGAVMGALLIVTGIYHNTRRIANAMDRLARQGAGSIRRLSGATRLETPVVPDVPPAAAPNWPQAMPMQPALQPVAAPVPMSKPAPAPTAPTLAAAPAPQTAPARPPEHPSEPAAHTAADPAPETFPVAPDPAPAAAPNAANDAAPQRRREAIRRLGPAS
ncbi:hypothetical protein [Paracoccus jeotgali]|uniref:hypothetical protein n=1 Tax=Paracoccus jeotgali TaxID=2065379 RepID=UPI0028AC6F55|nr:hypothetical protein [Paracoccus jeotgali]